MLKIAQICHYKLHHCPPNDSYSICRVPPSDRPETASAAGSTRRDLEAPTVETCWFHASSQTIKQNEKTWKHNMQVNIDTIGRSSWSRDVESFDQICAANLLLSAIDLNPNGYGSIPIDTFLVGWTSIYQLFWGSTGVPGFWSFDPSPNCRCTLLSTNVQVVDNSTKISKVGPVGCHF
jgi:hypothetical protein